LIAIDSENYRWILYKDNESFFLDILCSHSAVDYSWVIELNDQEKRKLEQIGRSYLNDLSHQVHYSAPGVIGNNSPYKNRKVTQEIIEKIRDGCGND